MKGPPLGPGGEDITWPNQVAPRGQKASSTRKIKPQTSNLTLGDLKDRLRPQDAIETIPGGDEYVVTNTNAPNSPCHVPVPDGISECGLSELPSSIHSDDETEHDAFFVQTCVEEVENAEYVAPLKPLLSTRVEDPLDDELDPRSRLREYVDSKRRLVAKKLCYAKPTRSSTFDFTGHKVAKTRILSKWLTKLTHLCCVLSLF